MNFADRQEFDVLVDKLCAAYNVPSYDVRKEAYWTALGKMSLIQFGRCVEAILTEDGPEKLPTAPSVWKIWHAIKIADRAKSAVTQFVPPPPQSKALMQINSMFLKYLARRRLKEGFKGDIGILTRRGACLDLVRWIEQCTEEGLRPDTDEIARIFLSDMQRLEAFDVSLVATA